MSVDRDMIARAIRHRLETITGSGLAPGLYLVATPIGNLGDITVRALGLLAAASVIYCEDTRHSRHLLASYGITTPLRRYDDHARDSLRQHILDQVEEGGVVALISDAGMPLVSDPGFKLVRAARGRGLPVTCLPGANAALDALVLSGQPPAPFLFEGFLPQRRSARRNRLAVLAPLDATLIFYEAPGRVGACLADMAAILGPRPASVLRELTKRFEEVESGHLAALAEHFSSGKAARGEFVIVCAPPQQACPPDHAALVQALRARLDAESLRDAADAVSMEFDLPRKQVYKLALEIKNEIKNKTLK